MNTLSKKWEWFFIGEDAVREGEEFGQAIARELNELNATNVQILSFDDSEQACELLAFVSYTAQKKYLTC